LENDFAFEAFEGLHESGWHQTQRHLDKVDERIVNDFALNEKTGLSRNLALGIVGLLTAAMATYYFVSSDSKSMDLSSSQNEAAEPSVENEGSLGITEDSIHNFVDSVELNKPREPISVSESKPNSEKEAPNKNTGKTKKTVATKPTKQVEIETKTAADLHISVGRIVDTKGIPIVDAQVISGNIKDTTDESGYYALKIPRGGAIIFVNHLSIKYQVEIDSNQNWEIVLDIANQQVNDYYPMNAANRFK